MAVDFEVYSKSGELVVSAASRLTRILAQIPVSSSTSSGSATFPGTGANAAVASIHNGSVLIALIPSLPGGNVVSWQWQEITGGTINPAPPGYSGFITVVGYR